MKKYGIIIYTNSYNALIVKQNNNDWFRISKKEVKKDYCSLRLLI